MRTASNPYNNRHRQAPCTHTDKQAVRTIGGEQCLIILVYISSATHPNRIGGFVVRGLFSSFMSYVSHRKHTSKLNIFSQTIKVSDCFLSSSVYSSTKLYPQNAKTRQCKKENAANLLTASPQSVIDYPIISLTNSLIRFSISAYQRLEP